MGFNHIRGVIFYFGLSIIVVCVFFLCYVVLNGGRCDMIYSAKVRKWVGLSKESTTLERLSWVSCIV